MPLKNAEKAEKKNQPESVSNRMGAAAFGAPAGGQNYKLLVTRHIGDRLYRMGRLDFLPF
jgi:hypothetical protein